MADLKPLIDALYRNFLLRDLFAKMVPGALVLLAGVWDTSALDRPASLMKIAGWTIPLFVVGTAWLVGFAVQTIGERTHLIRQHPSGTDYDDSSYRYRRRQEFARRASEEDHRQVERYTIIQEACGNAGTALVVALLVGAARASWLGRLGLICQALPQVGLAAVLAIALLSTNWSHMKKRYTFIDRVLDPDGWGK